MIYVLMWNKVRRKYIVFSQTNQKNSSTSLRPLESLFKDNRKNRSWWNALKRTWWKLNSITRNVCSHLFWLDMYWIFLLLRWTLIVSACYGVTVHNTFLWWRREILWDCRKLYLSSDERKNPTIVIFINWINW